LKTWDMPALVSVFILAASIRDGVYTALRDGNASTLIQCYVKVTTVGNTASLQAVPVPGSLCDDRYKKEFPLVSNQNLNCDAANSSCTSDDPSQLKLQMQSEQILFASYAGGTSTMRYQGPHVPDYTFTTGGYSREPDLTQEQNCELAKTTGLENATGFCRQSLYADVALKSFTIHPGAGVYCEAELVIECRHSL
jgi:hypothetical protein